MFETKIRIKMFGEEPLELLTQIYCTNYKLLLLSPPTHFTWIGGDH